MEKKKGQKAKTGKTGAELDFEEALRELEEIARDLEGGDMGLEESIKNFERGMELAGLCHKKLQEAEKRIKILQKAADGSFEAKEIPADHETGEIDDDMQGSLL